MRPSRPSADIAPAFARNLGESATSIFVGEAEIGLWPSRFSRAEFAERERGWIDVYTSYVHVRIGPSRPAWAD